MILLRLYTTSHCHLCEQAEDILNKIQSSNFSCKFIEISDDEVLLNKYGLTIPVIERVDTKQELKWPFNQEAILKLLDRCD